MMFNLVLIGLVAAVDSVPTFDIHLDLPPSERHLQVVLHFQKDLLPVQNLFIHSLMPEYLKFFEDNLEAFKAV